MRSPTVKVLVRLAAVLGEDPLQLLVLPSESRRQELVDLIRHAPPATIERLLRVIAEERPPRRPR